MTTHSTAALSKAPIDSVLVENPPVAKVVMAWVMASKKAEQAKGPRSVKPP